MLRYVLLLANRAKLFPVNSSKGEEEPGAAVVIQGLTCPAENQWDQRRDLGPRGGRGVRYC
jgi:hypothetical protein